MEVLHIILSVIPAEVLHIILFVIPAERGYSSEQKCLS